jgi:hypothetical protein
MNLAELEIRLTLSREKSSQKHPGEETEFKNSSGGALSRLIREKRLAKFVAHLKRRRIKPI